LNKNLSLAGHGDFQSNMLEEKRFLVPNEILRNAEESLKKLIALCLSGTAALKSGEGF